MKSKKPHPIFAVVFQPLFNLCLHMLNIETDAFSCSHWIR